MDRLATSKQVFERARMRIRQKMINAAVEYINFTGYTTVTIPISIEKHKLYLMIADRHEVITTLRRR
jgi:hypothetical protein